MIYLLCMIAGGALVAGGFFLAKYEPRKAVIVEEIQYEPPEEQAPNVQEPNGKKPIEDQVDEMLHYDRKAAIQGVAAK